MPQPLVEEEGPARLVGEEGSDRPLGIANDHLLGDRLVVDGQAGRLEGVGQLDDRPLQRHGLHRLPADSGARSNGRIKTSPAVVDVTISDLFGPRGRRVFVSEDSTSGGVLNHTRIRTRNQADSPSVPELGNLV